MSGTISGPQSQADLLQGTSPSALVSVVHLCQRVRDLWTADPMVTPRGELLAVVRDAGTCDCRLAMVSTCSVGTYREWMPGTGGGGAVLIDLLGGINSL